eukprot:gnl/Carplike_NY0171/14302_a21100_77.p1 GENE.gnl/Carplike_NY0171/14302_a21100_77~~gnl/Carplike_NY0171/14302_a21100_77.p1  ORF type:complete len:160 (-),score=13.47 gnl/Carplike_NY0171/14302_a21100_77:119-598(-)
MSNKKLAENLIKELNLFALSMPQKSDDIIFSAGKHVSQYLEKKPASLKKKKELERTFTSKQSHLDSLIWKTKKLEKSILQYNDDALRKEYSLKVEIRKAERILALKQQKNRILERELAQHLSYSRKPLIDTLRGPNPLSEIIPSEFKDNLLGVSFKKTK